MLETSYKDLKFMVCNHNYFCNNLITVRGHYWYWSNKWQGRKECKQQCHRDLEGRNSLCHGALQEAQMEKNLPAVAETRSPGEGHSNQLQYSCLENPIDRGAWQAAVHRIVQSQTWLKRLSRNISIHLHKWERTMLCNSSKNDNFGLNTYMQYCSKHWALWYSC